VIRPALVCALLAAVPPAAAADDLKVNATVLPQGRIFDTTSVRLVITIEGSSIPDVSSPKLPAMKNLKITGGPSTARNSSYSFLNGKISSTNALTLSYFLTPVGAGPAEVPSFDIVIGGTTYRTQPLRFNVEAGRSGPAPPGAPSAGSADGYGDEDAGSGPIDVFLQAKLGATTVWSGQPVLLDVTLFAAAPVAGFNWTDLPSLRGFWAEDLSVEPGRDRRMVVINGRQYAAYPVARKVLVPTGSGPLTVEPFVAQVQVRRSSRDPFASFFNLGGLVNVLRKTTPLKIDVKPVPETGRPADFSGAVGAFKMKVTADRTALDLGDGVAVRVTVEGDGSLQSATPPALGAPPDVKIYDPKALETTPLGADHLGARKTWEWVVVPLTPGAVKVPAATFAYFDPLAASYKVLKGEIPELTVKRGTGAASEAVAGRSEVQANQKDIAFLKTLRGPLAEVRPPIQKRGWFTALLVLPLVLMPAGIVYGRRRGRLMSDRGFARARRAARAASRRLDRAAGRASESPAEFHQEVAGALVDYVADRANRSASGLTYDQLDELLAAKRVPDETRRRYRACLETCDFARYVPDSAKPESVAGLVAEARAILRALETVA
jgi:hypothetical protein